MRTLNKYLLLACVLVLGVVEAAQASSFVVPLNRSRLISTGPNIAEALVANPKIADIHVHGTNKLSVIGISRGQTTLRIMGEDGNVIRSLPISVTYDLPAIRQSLRNFMPGEDIGVELINNNIALMGEVSDASAVDRALQIVSQFVEVDRNQGFVSRASSSNGPRDQIVNLLKVTSGQQVMLRVRVGEIRRNALKELGISLQGLSRNGSNYIRGGSSGGIPALTGSNDLQAGFFEVASNSFGFLAGTVGLGEDLTLGASLEMLETDGLLKILAEPNLVALSGEQAEFLAGGEVPIPVAQPNSGSGSNFVTIDYRPFGVSVSFIPYVLSENRIRLSVMPEVSELSTEDGVVVNGFSVPALTTRRAKTTVELAPGESFMIAGLIRDQVTSVLQQLPGVKEIPILGGLFRSTQFQRNETELVIAVTPYLVDPQKSEDVRLPTDGFRPPSTMELFFYGALSSIANGERKLSQTPSLEGPIGFMVD